MLYHGPVLYVKNDSDEVWETNVVHSPYTQPKNNLRNIYNFYFILLNSIKINKKKYFLKQKFT